MNLILLLLCVSLLVLELLETDYVHNWMVVTIVSFGALLIQQTYTLLAHVNKKELYFSLHWVQDECFIMARVPTVDANWM